MTFLSIGDLAQSFRLRNHDVQLKRTMVRLTEEMTTGLVADTASAVHGDYAALAGIERSLTRTEAFRTAANEAASVTETVQIALESSQAQLNAAMPSLLAASHAMTDQQIDTLAQATRQRLGSVLSTLNARVADRYVFSGMATDSPAVSDSVTLVAAAQVAVAGQASAGTVAAALQIWFDLPAGSGGFLDQIYGGSQDALAAFQLSEGESARLGITAADPAIRDSLRGLVLASLVDSGVLAGDREGRANLLRTAGETLVNAEASLTGLRADLGATEEVIDAAATHAASERHRLQIARNDILAVDPYDTASALEAVKSQTEMLYTLTGRLSQLRLSDYLK